MMKKDFLKKPVRHIDITSFDAVKIIESMKGMSFTARDLAEGADIYDRMLKDRKCAIIMAIACSTSAAGCMQVYAYLVRYNMVDAIVAMDFFEALGFRHYQGTPQVDDTVLCSLYIDRIYDTYIDEEELQACDRTVCEIADGLPPRPHSSREFIWEMGKYLTAHAKKEKSLVQATYEHDVPIFCPAFSDSSAGFGLVLHQHRRPDRHVSIDSVKDFRELTEVKKKVGTTGLVIIGVGVPKNFIQDTVICAEILGKEVPMHKYAVQITVADVRDGPAPAQP
jgi:deoxyhypusine synthase